LRPLRGFLGTVGLPRLMAAFALSARALAASRTAPVGWWRSSAPCSAARLTLGDECLTA
jgi:hypothetical protein